MANKKETLPEAAYVAVDGQDVLCLVKRGEPGYHLTDWKLKKSITAQQFADQMNERINVTTIQAEAMLNGSMFGWQTKSADPAYVAKMGARRHAEGVAR